MSNELKVGDVVRLKSGGPNMTVSGQITPTNQGVGVLCGWFAADLESCMGYRTHSFLVDSLEPVCNDPKVSSSVEPPVPGTPSEDSDETYLGRTFYNKRRWDFHKELEVLVNWCSMEMGSDTPDFVLAEFLVGCLRVFDAAVKCRDQWYGHEDTPLPLKNR